MKNGFIYEWVDIKTGLKYIGKHEGSVDDGYIGSGTCFIKEYYKRPNDFSRNILWFSENITTEELASKEEEFLLSILDDELFYGKNKKYYNIVKNSSGYTSENNPMKNPLIVERMMNTSTKNGRKNPWENSVKKYGIDGARKINSKNSNPSNAGKGNLGKTKSEEHKRKIAEAIKIKFENKEYKPGRKKIIDNK